MDIGIVCGAGPAALRGLGGAPDPLVRPGDCVVIGNRFDAEEEAADERELAPALLQQISGPQLRRGDPPGSRRRSASAWRCRRARPGCTSTATSSTSRSCRR